MRDGLRFVDRDMHVMELADRFDRHLDPRFKHRVSAPVGADGRPCRGTIGSILIDGLPTSDFDLQQYRKRRRPGRTWSTQLLSGSRLADTGRLDLAIARDDDAEARVGAMQLEGVRLTPREYFRRNGSAAVEGGEPAIESTARLIGADRMCISTDYSHFDSNVPNVASNMLATVPRDIAADILLGGARLYGFTEADFQKADAAAAAPCAAAPVA